MIISGGVNIYPQEIEDLFSLHPAVTDIAVIGVPDDEMGERVVAFVEAARRRPTPGDELAAELTAYAREHIAHFKVPREFHFRDELPRTPTGKMVKGRLREEYVQRVGAGVLRDSRPSAYWQGFAMPVPVQGSPRTDRGLPAGSPARRRRRSHRATPTITSPASAQPQIASMT